MKLPQEKPAGNSNSLSVIAPFEIIEKELYEVRTVINKELRREPYEEGVSVFLRHIQARNAKMLRPGMLLLCGLCCGDLNKEHIKAAAIFEMIHNATLLHDDVIDQSNKRRGSETVNTLYGNESAVLLGDFLLSKVFSMSSMIDPQTAQTIAAAAEKTCKGEIKQNLQRANWQLNEEKYIQIIADKTAALFSNACLTGAQLVTDDKETLETFATFGLNFGIAFQLKDDMLDITADEKTTGKKSRDIENANVTLPLIRLLSIIKDTPKTDLINKLHRASSDEALLADIRKKLEENECLKYTKNRIAEHKQLAISAISAISDNNAKEALINTINFLIN